jgi:predicted naringenin-chalcone synthase
VSAVVAGIGLAYPGAVTQEDVWSGFFAGHYAGPAATLAKRIFGNAGVVSRHAAVNPLLEDPSGWSTQRRMRRYLAEALPLGKEAVGRALADAGVSPADVGLFAVCSCTGYATPGLDILLARDLGMSPRTQRLFIGHMGCYAALPGLGVAADFVALHNRPAVLLCVELTSLHVQPSTIDTQQIVAHSLFSDAAAAVVLVPSDPHHPAHRIPGEPAGYEVRDARSVTDTTSADHMTWDVTDLGFRMGLSNRVPEVLSRYVGQLAGDLLDAHGLTLTDVDGWAVHPGGPRILSVVERELRLPPAALAASRATLAEHGNCSSPTVLLILDALRREAAGARNVVALAFGPGLTLYAVLLRRTGAT